MGSLGREITGWLGNEKSFKQVAFFSSFPLETWLYLLPLNIFVLKTKSNKWMKKHKSNPSLKSSWLQSVSILHIIDDSYTVPMGVKDESDNTSNSSVWRLLNTWQIQLQWLLSNVFYKSKQLLLWMWSDTNFLKVVYKSQGRMWYESSLTLADLHSTRQWCFHVQMLFHFGNVIKIISTLEPSKSCADSSERSMLCHYLEWSQESMKELIPLQ